LVAAGVIALLLSGPAAGGERSNPVATIACAHKPGAPPSALCQESGSIDVPGDSFASQSTDTVPSQASEADATVEPSVDTAAGFKSMWTTVVANNPSLNKVKSAFVQKLVVCDMIANAFSVFDAQKVYMEMDNVPEHRVPDVYAASLYVCLAIAFSQPPPGSASAQIAHTAAASPCQANVAAPIQIARSGSGFLVSAHGTTSKARRPAVAVSCRRKGRGIVITLKPRRRGRKLRPLIGPHLSIGFANRSTSPVHLTTTFAFKR
jgi:hypothetical protein